MEDCIYFKTRDSNNFEIWDCMEIGRLVENVGLATGFWNWGNRALFKECWKSTFI